MNFELAAESTYSFLAYDILGLLALVENPITTLMGGVALSSGTSSARRKYWVGNTPCVNFW